MDNRAYNIFKNGSVTFFTASLFFPKHIKEDVFNLYAFVRVFDDFIDAIPQDEHSYMKLKLEYHAALVGNHTDNSVLQNFIELQDRHQFDQQWVDAFFTSMEMDMHKSDYWTLEQTLKYIYGSAEVIGLMMARIMNLPNASHPYAQSLGRAFQYMNMIRDIAQDQKLSRTYLPKEEYQKFGLENLTEGEAKAKPEQFAKFIQTEIERYRGWRQEASIGLRYIPKRMRVPIEAATEMFDYTMSHVERNPLQVYSKQLKPGRLRVLWAAVTKLL